MKKLLATLVVIAAIAATAAFLIHRRVSYRPIAADLAPAETILFAHIPHVAATVRRFEGSELYKLMREPEVVAFLERPRAPEPAGGEAPGLTARIVRVMPREGFVAVTSIDGPMPRAVGGFAFAGSRSDVEELLAPSWSDLKKAHPAGKADLATYAGAEIETFSDQELTVARTFHDGWFFVANDLELLQRTLDRQARKPGNATTLAQNALFQKATARLPIEREVMLFGQLGVLTDRLAALMAATGQPAAKAPAATQAFAAATKLEGAQFRDTIFLLAPASAPQPPLARHSLALTSPGTLLYYAAALPEKIELPQNAVVLDLFASSLAPMEKALGENGLTFANLGAAFGPEVGTLVDWPIQALQPGFVAAVDVRDAVKAQAFVKALTSGAAGLPAWTAREEGGVTFHQMPKQGLSLTAPTIALSEKFLLFGLNSDSVGSALARLTTGEEKLSAAPAFAAAEKSVAAPTSAYAYLDLRGFFERAYGTFRPFLAMSLAFMPEAAKYVDAGKLPTTEAISKHLGAMVYSQSTSADGVLIESTGTITMNQALLGIAAGSAAATLPALMKGGPSPLGFDPSQLFPFSKKPAPPAPAAPLPAAPEPIPDPLPAPPPPADPPAAPEAP